MAERPDDLKPAKSTQPKGDNAEQGAAAKSVDPQTAFALERHFPDSADLLLPYSLKSYDDAVVTLDANALLLPYSMGTDDLSAIAAVYRKLSKEGRLFVPARAVREFIRHRDEKLAAMITTLNNTFSDVRMPPDTLSFVLDGMDAYRDLKAAQKKMEEGRQQYGKAIRRITEAIKAWRGNDPVSELYRDVFDQRIIEHEGTDSDIAKEWEERVNSRRPPGYKDASKADFGVGDFLIWKSILRVGATQKRAQVFVTGEQKSDWFVRGGGQAIYPRPELVDEYRRASNGQVFVLSTLADLLAKFGARDEVVNEVRKAETNARKYAIPWQPRDLGSLFGDWRKERPQLFHPNVPLIYFPNAGPMNFDHIEQYMKEFPVKPVRREEREQDLFLWYDAAELNDEVAAKLLKAARLKVGGAVWFPSPNNHEYWIRARAALDDEIGGRAP